MTRKLRPLLIKDFDSLPCACPGCAFWESDTPLEAACGAVCDKNLATERYGEISREWGESGRVAIEDDEILGFIRYAPPGYFPQSGHFASGPPSPQVVLLTCIHIRDDARRHGLGSLLLRAALRDLVSRGERTVQAFGGAVPGSDMALQPVIGVEFLLRNGFNVVRPHPSYPLMELDLRSIAKWAENLEAVLQSLRIPLRTPTPVPTPMNIKEFHR